MALKVSLRGTHGRGLRAPLIGFQGSFKGPASSASILP